MRAAPEVQTVKWGDGPPNWHPRKADVGPGLISPACQGSDSLLQSLCPSLCAECACSWASTLMALRLTVGCPGCGTVWPMFPPSPVCPSRCPCISVMDRDTQQRAAGSLPFVLLNFIRFPSSWAQGHPGSSSLAKGSYLKRWGLPRSRGLHKISKWDAVGWVLRDISPHGPR